MASRARLWFASLALTLTLPWAHASETVTLASTEYPPYYGSSLPQGGVIAEIARQAFKRTGYELRIEWDPWARALKTAQEGSDDTTNLRKLGAGRVDLILIDKGVAQYLLRTAVPELQSRLQWLEPAIETFPLYVGFVKAAPRHERLLQAFTRGLKELERDGTLQRLVTEAGL